MLFPKLSKSAQSLVVGWVESDSRAITRGSLDECPAIRDGEQTLHAAQGTRASVHLAGIIESERWVFPTR